MKKAFTLIELLVVVLIIGILAAIALPQYEKTVFKSRVTEVAINLRAIESCFDMYLLQNGFPASGIVYLENMGCAAELSGGSWDSSHIYKGKYFDYTAFCGTNQCSLSSYYNGPSSSMYVMGTLHQKNGTADNKTCYTQLTERGRIGCKMIESMGYEYKDQQD